MTLVPIKGLYLTPLVHALDGDVTMGICLSGGDAEAIHIKVTASIDQFNSFAEKLQVFPKDSFEMIQLIWQSGKQILPEGSLDVGKVRLSAKVIDSRGYSELRLEILQPKTFKPGMKFSTSLIAAPALLNRLGLSLETWLPRRSEPFAFRL